MHGPVYAKRARACSRTRTASRVSRLKIGPSGGVHDRRLPAHFGAAKRAVAHRGHAMELDEPLVDVAGPGGDGVGGSAAEEAANEVRPHRGGRADEDA